MAPRIHLNRTFDSPYDVRVTDLSRPLNAPASAGGTPGDGFSNRNLTATTPFVLVGLAPSIRALPRNLRRVGLMIQNLDGTADLRFSFGNDLGENGLLCTPRGTILLDFTTPPDELYLYSAADITVIVANITRGF